MKNLASSLKPGEQLLIFPMQLTLGWSRSREQTSRNAVCGNTDMCFGPDPHPRCHEHPLSQPGPRSARALCFPGVQDEPVLSLVIQINLPWTPPAFLHFVLLPRAGDRQGNLTTKQEHECCSRKRRWLRKTK